MMFAKNGITQIVLRLVKKHATTFVQLQQAAKVATMAVVESAATKCLHQLITPSALCSHQVHNPMDKHTFLISTETV